MDVNRMWAVQADALRIIGINDRAKMEGTNRDKCTVSIQELDRMLEYAYRSGYSAGYAEHHDKS